jgi:hypothetical protein
LADRFWPSHPGTLEETASGAQSFGLQPSKALFLKAMKAAYDELPGVSVSRMRASGEIRPEDKTATVAFGDVAFTVSLGLHRWPNGGNWSRFLCPGCGRWARILRLFEGQIMCWRCCRARGLRARVELIRTEKRAAYHAPRLIARLTGPPARLNPRPGRMLDRRANIEARLRRAGIVARQFALNEHDNQLAKMNAKPLPSVGLDEADPNIHTDADMRQSK